MVSRNANHAAFPLLGTKTPRRLVASRSAPRQPRCYDYFVMDYHHLRTRYSVDERFEKIKRIHLISSPIFIKMNMTLLNDTRNRESDDERVRVRTQPSYRTQSKSSAIKTKIQTQKKRGFSTATSPTEIPHDSPSSMSLRDIKINQMLGCHVTNAYVTSNWIQKHEHQSC